MIRSIRHNLHVIVTLCKMQFSTQMMYRWSFWGAFFADLSLFVIHLVFFSVITQNGSVGGWGIDQLTVFVGAFTALDGLYMATYFFGIISLPDKIRTGKLDLAIIKPVNTLFYTSFSSLNPGSFFLFFAGLGIVAYGGARLGALSFINIIRFLLVFLLMYLLNFSLMVCIRCASFWFVRIHAFHRIEDTFIEFSFKLPMPAIEGLWRIMLFIVLPYGLLANMPASALFGAFGLRSWCLCIGVTAFFLCLAILLWNRGRKRYDSPSS